MYKKFFMGIAAMAALTLVSCSSEDLNSLSDNSSKNEAISFDGYLGRSAVAVNGSRGSVVDIPALKSTELDKKGFGVFGYYNSSVTDHGSAPEQSFDANLFNNEQVSCPKDGADWTYSPLKYWPAQGHIDFLAYAPYVANKALTGSKIKFTVSETISNQTDLLWANAENKTKDNLSSTENKVKFQFAHALSRLGYTVKLNRAVSESDATITLNKITLAGSKDQTQNAFYKEGTIDLSTGKWSTSSSTGANYNGTKRNFEWFSGDNKTDGEKTLSDDVNKAIKNSGNEYLFVIPQDFSKTEPNADQLYVIVEYTIKYKSGSAQPTVSYKVYKKLGEKFLQSKAYTINLTIGLTPIEFNAEVTDWDTKNGDITVDSWN